MNTSGSGATAAVFNESSFRTLLSLNLYFLCANNERYLVFRSEFFDYRPDKQFRIFVDFFSSNE